MAFYHKLTLQELVAIKNYFIDKTKSREIDIIDDWIRMIMLSRLSGHSSGFLSVRTMPLNQTVTAKKQRYLNKINNLEPVKKDIHKLVIKKYISLTRNGLPRENVKHELSCTKANDSGYIDDNTIKLIVTSPPFLNMVNYYKDNWLRCWFANINEKKYPLDIHQSWDTWMKFVRKCFIEFARVLTVDGVVAFEVGEVNKGKILLKRIVICAVKDLPLKIIGVIINKQNFTKTSNCWGISNNLKGTNTNRIALLRRL